MSRIKVFAGVQVASTGGVDTNGIPYVAYDNTKGDTPVSAVILPDQYAWEVTYE